jgi:hypothetical protein
MNEFYNRYRNLFSLNNNTNLQYKTINENKPIFTQPKEFPSKPYFSVQQNEPKPVNYFNLGRSPAID